MTDEQSELAGMFGEDSAADSQQQQQENGQQLQPLTPIEVPRFRKQQQQQQSDEQAAGAEAAAATAAEPLTLYHRPAAAHSLWAHLLWNSARHCVRLMDTGAIDVKGKTVLELGCGLGAPSIVAALNGARSVVATDYAEEPLLAVVAENAARALVLDPKTRVAETFNDEAMDERILAAVTRIRSASQQPAAEEQDEQGQQGETDGDAADAPAPPSEAPPQQPNSSGTGNNSSSSGKRLNFVVEGLNWGNERHVQRISERSGCIGFEVIFLSDLLFNHVCHDALLSTVSRLLVRDSAARAYVVFSFHRPYKKDEDLAFFAKCAFYGLRFALVETNNDYPLMFPDDAAGQDDVRKPVYLYELALNMPAGAENDRYGSAVPLDRFRFDVVVQGTGYVETLVSASCARAGLSVLHLDAAQQYGTAFQSAGHAKFLEFLTKWRSLTNVVSATPCADLLEVKIVECKARQLQSEHATETDAAELEALEFELQDAKSILASRELYLDTFTTAFLASSSLIEAIAHSQMAEHCEFQNVHRVVALHGHGDGEDGSNGGDSSSALPPAKLIRIPVSRKDMFNTGMSALSPLECRRLMRFVSDISDRSSLERDTDVHRQRFADEIIARMQGKHTELDLQQTPLSALVTSKYSFSEALLQLVTLGGALLHRDTPAAAAIPVVFSYLTSIGRYAGATPYLAPMYSASDLPQIFSRMAAVWGAVFALERAAAGLVKVAGSVPVVVGRNSAAAANANSVAGGGASAGGGGAADGNDETAAAASSAASASPSSSPSPSTTSVPIPNDISLPSSGVRVVLDNDQHIHAKALVLPRRGGAGSDGEFVRVALVLKRPLVSWQLLEEECSDAPIDDADRSLRMQTGDPIAVGYAQLMPTMVSTSSSAPQQQRQQIRATFLQWADCMQSSPQHVLVVHLTAKRYHASSNNSGSGGGADTTFELTPQAFLDAARRELFVASSDADARRAVWNKHVVSAYSFCWGEEAAFVTSMKTNPAQNSDNDNNNSNDETLPDFTQQLASLGLDETEQQDFAVVETRTLFGELNDNCFADEAERVFRRVLRSVGRHDTIEEMPIIKGRDPEQQRQ